ncbi:MAG: hypothetical protein ABH818_00045 [Patescibacteria group bacterium]|nr:hypothetical protein [Patescibacteria group bacterium]MBU1870752.1 hypothetical protein [Patescibacteria group bacterium]
MLNKASQINNKTKEPIDNDLDITKNKNIAALSYVWIICLVPLLGKRDSKFAQFHAKQGLTLFIIEIIVGLLSWLPVLGQLAMLTLLVISVIGIIKTLNGEWWKIPYIYNWSKKINL